MIKIQRIATTCDVMTIMTIQRVLDCSMVRAVGFAKKNLIELNSDQFQDFMDIYNSLHHKEVFYNDFEILN